MNYSRTDIYYWFILFGLMLIGYWVYIVVAPTFEIAQKTNILLNKMDTILTQGIEQNALSIEQNKKIIDSQKNSTGALKEIIQEVEKNRDNQVEYLFTVLNQSNVIGNATADLILESIANVQQLETNQTEERRIQTAGIIKGFSYLLEDLDEESDKNKEILIKIAEQRNIILPNKTITDEFQIDPQSRTFTFPNGTSVNITDLFKPASYGSGLDIAVLNLSAGSFDNNDNLSGNISGFLGGPLLTNETIPFELRNLSNSSNNTSNPQ